MKSSLSSLTHGCCHLDFIQSTSSYCPTRFECSNFLSLNDCLLRVYKKCFNFLLSTGELNLLKKHIIKRLLATDWLCVSALILTLPTLMPIFGFVIQRFFTTMLLADIVMKYCNVFSFTEALNKVQLDYTHN